MPTNLPSEEDLRSRVLLPFLTALGIGPEQVRLERQFRVRLGRTEVEVGSAKVRERLAGRLDVLVQNSQGENLFVVEVKAEDEQLTDEDRDQGISYARLLDQVAPFVLLTNGREAQLFDTITKQPLTEASFPEASAFWANGRLLATAEDVRIRYEALRHFLGYSTDNIRAFTNAQQARRMEHLRGGPADRNKKYVPELYVARQEVGEAIHRFMDGRGVAFALVGESGVGKTNEMCALADQLGADHVALFFSGSALHASIGDTLLEEFNWYFSDQIGTPELVRRLADIARHTGRRVVIMVDAVDEASVASFEQSTADFAGRIRDFGGLIKLIVSARREEWDRFATFRDDPSQLALALDMSWQDREQQGAEQIPGAPSRNPFFLSPFSERELDLATTAYQRFFGFTEAPRGRLRSHCHLPFMLRVASEVYGGRSGPLPDDISEETLLRAWLNRKLNRMSDPDRARRELEAVALAAFHHAQEPADGLMTIVEAERIPEARVRKIGSWRIGETLGEELVSHGVLARHSDPDGRTSVAFFYGRLRDYMIARHVLGLDRMAATEFREILPVLLTGHGHVLQSVLFWHLQHAPHDHRQVLAEVIHGRAAIFLNYVERVLAELVPGIRRSIEPYTTGQIGIAYETDDYGLRHFGLYPVGEVENKRVVELRPRYDGTRNPFLRELVRLGGRIARGGGTNFTNADPEAAAAEFAIERVRKAVREGGLDETASDVIVRESIVALATHHRKILNLSETPHLQHLFSGIVPLDLRNVMARLQAYFGREHYQSEWAREQVEKKTRHVRFLPQSFVSITYDAEAMGPLAKRAEEEAMAGKRFPPRTTVGNEDLRVFAELLDLVLESEDEIDRPILPPPDLPPPYPDYRLHWAYSDRHLAALLESFFVEGVRAYQAVVERNFPGLLEHFELYNRLPVTVVAVCRRPSDKIDQTDWGEVTYTFVPEERGPIRAEVHIDPRELVFGLPGGSERLTVVRSGGPVVRGWRVTGLQRLISPYDAPGFGASGRGGTAARLAPVRAWVYDRILRELRTLTADLLREKLDIR